MQVSDAGPASFTTQNLRSNLTVSCCLAGRVQLAGFPEVLGIKSYFLDVPQETGAEIETAGGNCQNLMFLNHPLSGCFSIYHEGKKTCECGYGCAPINHKVTEVGCEAMCCGEVLWHQGFKTSAARKSRLSEANLKLKEQLEIQVRLGHKAGLDLRMTNTQISFSQAKKDAMQHERQKNRKVLKLMREEKAQPLSPPPRASPVLPPKPPLGPASSELVHASTGTRQQYVPPTFAPPPFAPPQFPWQQKQEPPAASESAPTLPLGEVTPLAGPVGEGSRSSFTKLPPAGRPPLAPRPIGEAVEDGGYDVDDEFDDEEDEDDASTPLLQSPATRSPQGTWGGGQPQAAWARARPIAEATEEIEEAETGRPQAEATEEQQQDDDGGKSMHRATTRRRGTAHGGKKKDGDSDFDSEFGEEFYPPGFRWVTVVEATSAERILS